MFLFCRRSHNEVSASIVGCHRDCPGGDINVWQCEDGTDKTSGRGPDRTRGSVEAVQNCT